MPEGASHTLTDMIRPKSAAVCSDNAIMGASEALFKPQVVFPWRGAVEGMRDKRLIGLIGSDPTLGRREERQADPLLLDPDDLALPD
jgi:hypothetical protein